jgi:NADH dehydrogenase (ubiquinone) 1 alpha subcomplex subunit 8
MSENESKADPNQMVMATSAVLSAATHFLFSECRAHFDAFMSCRSTLDPQRNAPPAVRCAELAKTCVECSQESFQRVALSPCRDLFRKFWRCLDNNDQNRIYCRAEERDFYNCTKEHLVLLYCVDLC